MDPRVPRQVCRPPPEPLVRAATNADIRQDLTDSVRRNLAVRSEGFVESWEFLPNSSSLTRRFQPASRSGSNSGSDSPCLDRTTSMMDAHLIQEWVRFCELHEEIRQAGLGIILSELFEGSSQSKMPRTPFWSGSTDPGSIGSTSVISHSDDLQPRPTRGRSISSATWIVTPFDFLYTNPASPTQRSCPPRCDLP